LFIVTLNHNIIHQYTEPKRLPGQERLFLDRMDKDMDLGFKLHDGFISHPDLNQRLHYVAFKLIEGLEDNNQGLIRTTSIYLAERYKNLTAIDINDKDGEKKVSLQCG